MRATTIVGVLTMVILATAVAAAQDDAVPAALTVRVHVLDRAAVAPRDWAFAEGDVATIYRKAGVAAVWDHVWLKIPADDRVPNVTIIVVTGRASQAAAKSFGVGADALAFVPGAAGNQGRLVYVFDDRVCALSSHSGIPYSALLGRVLAHEIGHVLLPFNSHSLTGIMREAIDSTSWQLEFFTNSQAQLIRTRLALPFGGPKTD